jgi:pyroglutamyl-peptidase
MGTIRALVTGFEPFGGEATNASREAVLRLPPLCGAIAISTCVLPTSYARSAPELEAAVRRTRPAIVLCVGQAGERTALNLERVAINVQDAALPDNDGEQPVDQPIAPRGAAARFSTLPVRAAVEALHAAGLPAEVSNSAGTFVCNHVFYSLMQLAARHRHRFRAGFLHVPRIARPEQQDAGPALSVADVARGIEVILQSSCAMLAPARGGVSRRAS